MSFERKRAPTRAYRVWDDRGLKNPQGLNQLSGDTSE